MGTFHGGSFRAIQEYFQQKTCRFCDHSFTSEGIQLLREEPGMMVVRITCCTCNRPLGVAIVGTGPLSENNRNKFPPEWTKKDCKKFADKPAITYDDVLSAHQFFNKLGADWSKHLPKYGRAAS